MNRKQRRARREQVVRQFSDMQTEGAGRWKLSIVSGIDVVNWIALGGGSDETDRDMAECLSVIGPALRQLESGDRPDFCCLLCGASMVTPVVFVVLRALTPEPKAAMLNGLCKECAMLPDGQERIFAFYRKNIMPDFQKAVIADMPPGKM